MCCTSNSKPKTLIRKDSSILISWENVFVCSRDKCAYLLEIFDDFCEWKQVYRGIKLNYTAERLAPSKFFKFRLRCDTGKTDWLEFKSATDTEQFYMRHLTRAIQFSKIPLIRKIISARPVLLETENNQNRTPLMHASENGDLNIVNFLVNLGAKVNQKTIALKRTALMLTVFQGHLEIAEYLINKGAEINVTDINGMTALHFAVDSGNLENVKFIVENAPDVNCKDNKGWTPLLRAIITGSSNEIIELLRDNGADYEVTDNKRFGFIKHSDLVGRSYLNGLVNRSQGETEIAKSEPS